MKRKQIPGNMDSSPQKMSRRKALATMAGAVGLAALPGVGHALNPIKKERRDIQTSAFTSIHTMRNAVSRQFTTFDLNTKIKAHLVGPGEKSVLVDHTSPGVITRMWFTINGWFWENWDLSKERWPDPTILKMLILRIYWDGEDYPSVECPIGDFFGIGHCEYKHYMSKYIGMSSGGFYCYFPMPFKKVRIEVENLHHRLTTSVFLNANYDQLESLPEGMGRFHCLYNAGTNPGYEPLTILQTKGHGHFIGCSLSMQSWLPNYLGYLEAPEFIYIDTEDKSVPTIVGSGLEDYFNGGWYFREGEFWWLPLPILQDTALIAVNQPLANSCLVIQNQRGTKTGQNHEKIKSRTLRPKYPLWNTSVSFAKVQICPLKNEGKSLFLSFTTHFHTIVTQMWLLQTVLTSNGMACENRVLNFVLHSVGHFQKRELAIEPKICHPYCPILGFVNV